MKEKKTAPDPELSRREGNTCIKLGAGVGVLGAVGATIAGTVCPLCIVAAPGLIAIGVFKRWRGRPPPEESSPNEPPRDRDD
ncbi:MAG: hypothetical protein RL417_406 [Pseudomonadota bacterium]|jgi:hypothetical protein